jgi:hypothetical protein
LSVELNIEDSREVEHNPFLENLKILNLEGKHLRSIKKNSAPILEKINQKLTLLLCNCPMGHPWFYTLVYEQLNLLEKYLLYSTSRIIVYDVIEILMSNLIALKAMFCQVSDQELREAEERARAYQQSELNNQTQLHPSSKISPRKVSPRMSIGKTGEFKIKPQKLDRESFKYSFQGFNHNHNQYGHTNTNQNSSNCTTNMNHSTITNPQ